MREVKKFWNWTTDAKGNRMLRLDGVIADESWYGDEITPKAFRAELNSGTGDITVSINSEGGDVFAASDIYAALKEYRGHITISIINAFSAASVIAMAGDTVEISATGLIMIHDPWTFTQGNSAEMKASAKMLDEIKESIINAYERKTHLPRKEISRLMEEETWLHAGKAVELGFADRISGADEMTSAAISSRRQIMNSFTEAIKAKRMVEANKNKISAAALRRRLEIYLTGR